MFIQTEETPNPATLKFLPGREVTGGGPVDFPDAATSDASPLAQRLFAVDGVRAVLLGRDFITVTKAAEREWPLLRPAILGAIMEHFLSAAPVLHPAAGHACGCGGGAQAGAGHCAEPESAVVTRIKELLETRVRPAVAQDGGDITFHGFEDGIVYLQMKGACSGCPSSTATLKAGIENMLRHYLPEVQEVRAVR